MADRSTPLWKQAFDIVDRSVGTKANELVRSEQFGTITALGLRGQRVFRQRLERASRRTLHAMNIPAASDMRRLLGQIALLEREVRDLRKQLADAPRAEGGPRGDDVRPGSRRRSHPA